MQIDENNFRNFILGSYFLSTGGGFESPGARFFAQQQLKKQCASSLSIGSVNDSDCLVALTFLGSPAIETERNHNFFHFERLIQAIQEIYANEITAVFPVSIGGGVPFAPIFLSSCFGIPILDADSTGRCLTALSMMSTHLAGIPLKKAFIINLMGDLITIESTRAQALERHARQIAISSGGACLIVPQVLTGEEAKRGLIAGSLTRALTIGQIIEETRDLNAVMEYTGGTFVGVGGVTLSTGFGLPETFKRRIILKNAEEKRVWEIWMDNEYNLLFENGELIAEVPDIITLCNPDTCEPLTLGQLYLHANVAICVTKAPDVWYSDKGLALVRPKRHHEGKAFLCGPSSVLRSIA